jgi:hypothetical protein
MNEAFLEKDVGDELAGQEGQSAAGVLQAATAQGVPLMYVDAEHLKPLADAPLSDEAKARIVQAVLQEYRILVPERMVTWNGEQTIAWWQIDSESSEAVGVGEDGTHQFLVIFTAEAKLLMLHAQFTPNLIKLVLRRAVWKAAAELTWDYFWREALGQVKSPTQCTEPVCKGEAQHLEAYQNAYKLTKSYMHDTVWPNLCAVVDCDWLQ